VKRSLGRKAAAFGAAVAASAAGLVLLNPPAAQAASCVNVEGYNTLGWVKATNNCSYKVDIRVHWSVGDDTGCSWINPGSAMVFKPYRDGASYRYWIDCHGA
jgi:hypothetical protein